MTITDSPAGGVGAMLRRLNRLGEAIPYALLALAARLFPAAVFWQSGRTKMDGLTIKPETLFLFEHEYALPILSPELAARLAATAEHALPVLLVLGLMTRLSALGLLAMTAVIQILVYPGAWVTHGLWATCLLLLVARGPGAWSLDRLMGFDRRD